MGYSSMFAGQDTSHRAKARFLFRLWVGIAYLILFLPASSLLTYTSYQSAVLGRYSISFAVLLALYLGVLLLWPMLFGLPGPYIDRVVQSIGYTLKYHPQSYIRFIAAANCLCLLGLMVIPLWSWGQDVLLQLGLLLMGLWVSVGPLIGEWGLNGWPVRRISFDWWYAWLKHNIYLWLPALLAVAVILFSTKLALTLSQNAWLAALALLPIAGVAWAIWRWRFLGVVGLIPASLIIPFEIRAGSDYSRPHAPVLLILLLLGLWILDMIRVRRIQLPRSLTVPPLLVFTGVVILAFIFGQLPWYPASPASLPAQVGGVLIFILAFAAFLLVGHYIRDLRWLQWMTWLFIGLGGLYILAELWPPLGYYLSPTDPLRWQANIGRFQPGIPNNSMFWTWIVALSFSQAFFNRRLFLGWRLLSGGVMLVAFYYMLFVTRFWVSGYLPCLVVVLMILWVGMPRLAVLATLLGMIGVTVKLQELMSDVVMIGDNSYSMSTRLDAWLIVLQLVKINPILGLGPANYYYYTPLIPIRGYFSRFNSHNQYVDLIAQTGILGLACFFWFAGAVGWMGWRLRSQVPDGFARAYVYGALGGLAGTMVAAALGDWVLPFTYNVGLMGFRASMYAWVFLGGLLALEQMYYKDNSQK